MEIYVINLKSSSDRRSAFDKMNSKYIDYTYFKAIDGNTNISKEKINGF